MLPEVDPVTGLLPESGSPHLATLDEVHDRFVLGAPFPERRQLIFNALQVYAELVWAVFPDARLRINGGFTTHKRWAAPEDADVAVVCPSYTETQVQSAVQAPLFTMLNAEGTVSGQRFGFAKAHVMGGLVDGFFVPEDVPEIREFFETFWASVTNADKEIVPGIAKGYVEVVNPNVAT